MTEKLYDYDSYIQEFDAIITSCQVKEDSSILLTLDRTAFFPEAGGQSCDSGSIIVSCGDDSIQLDVIDVSIKDDIYHTCRISENVDIFAIKQGSNIHGIIDFSKRLGYMQHHTGEHIVSGIIHKKFNLDNVGFHLSDNICTCDYNGPLDDVMVKQVEYEVNRAIQANKTITCYYPKEDELNKLDYRSKDGIVGDVRIVDIEGYDVCACCAPHLKATGEIGCLLITDAIPYKGGIRLTLSCGTKAINYISEYRSIISQASNLLSANVSNIPDAINKLIASRDQLRLDAMNAARDCIIAQIDSIKSDYKDDAKNNLIIITKPWDNKVLRDAINYGVALFPDVYVAVIACSESSNQASFIIGSQNMDCGIIADEIRQKNIAKCGGSAAMIQGQAPDYNLLINLLK